MRPLLVILREDVQLAKAFLAVVTPLEPVQLDSILAYKLYSMGLVKWQGNQVIPRCQLYRHYFRERLGIIEQGSFDSWQITDITKLEEV